MNRKQRRMLARILLAGALFMIAVLIPAEGWRKNVLFLVPYAVIGWDILWSALRGIVHGQLFDENFLMSIASLGAFATGEGMEGAAVMLFYQIGELFQNCAVARSRRSIAELMDICPDYANVETEDGIKQTDPSEIPVGTVILVKPGEKIPLDGIVAEGESTLDTAALTGEAAPRGVCRGDTVLSGCINGEGVLRICSTKPYDQSTAAKIVELVENASVRKAKAENFITKFARWYTPTVVIAALLLGVVPPLFLGEWSMWIHRALIFLVISCPCALVISVPLSFFGGIGGASRAGILVKGGNYLEVLAHAQTVVFDKTGTLTEGTFRVVSVHPRGIAEKELLTVASHAEMYSDHPLARSVLEAYGVPPDAERVDGTEELPGRGVRCILDGKTVCAGNARLMKETGVQAEEIPDKTVIHIAREGEYLGYLVLADALKAETPETVTALKQMGIRRTVMLSGDNRASAEALAATAGIEEVHAQLLPADKVEWVERMLKEKTAGSLVFVGDGINDAPVLRRSDVGIAMGAMGSDAAIEAADVVLMDDSPAKVPLAIRIARRTMAIVYQNIIFALTVKGMILLLGALGRAGMWAAVFADVGVCVIAILNASRALRIPREKK